jgi:antitoxin (DNA-binding transcriptional repressor) of toxin-antitoxin stability system
MGIRELRDNLTAAVRRVRGGETVEVTHDGELVALLTRVPPHRIERLILLGDAAAPRPLEAPICRHPVVTGTTPTAALEDDRSGG